MRSVVSVFMLAFFTVIRYFVQAMPLVIFGAMFALHIYLFTLKYFIYGQRKKGAASSHLPGFCGTFLMIFFYLYMNLTKSSLDMFNCNPTVPSDGATQCAVAVCCYHHALKQ